MNMERLFDAARYATLKHHGQNWKDRSDLLYMTHVLDVAQRLAVVHPEDEVLLLGALLHDVVEDTDVSEAEIAKRFGPEVAALVMEGTDDTSLPEAERRRLQAVHVRHASDRAKRFKLADKASNLTALARTPPVAGRAQRRLRRLGAARHRPGARARPGARSRLRRRRGRGAGEPDAARSGRGLHAGRAPASSRHLTGVIP